MRCLHCRQDRRTVASRDLCRMCYDDIKIRRLYPCKKDTGPKFVGETEEELDALIAHQYQNLPPWWELETRRLRELGIE